MGDLDTVNLLASQLEVSFCKHSRLARLHSSSFLIYVFFIRVLMDIPFGSETKLVVLAFALFLGLYLSSSGWLGREGEAKAGNRRSGLDSGLIVPLGRLCFIGIPTITNV